MLNRFSLLFCFFLLGCLSRTVLCVDFDGWLNIELQHSLGCQDEKYCRRGTISVKSLRSGAHVINQTPLTIQQVKELKQLAENDSFYTIRALVSGADGQETEYFSSVKAAALVKNNLADVITAWVLNTGSVAAVSVQVANTTHVKPNFGDTNFATRFMLRHVDLAPVYEKTGIFLRITKPDTASYIQKIEREREAREKGEFKDNRSFLSKYWMYIVPVAIFVLISGASNPDSGNAR